MQIQTTVDCENGIHGSEKMFKRKINQWKNREKNCQHEEKKFVEIIQRKKKLLLIEKWSLDDVNMDSMLYVNGECK